MNRSNRRIAFGASLGCIAAGLALVVGNYLSARPSLPPEQVAAAALPADPLPPRAEQWKKVQEARNKGLPQTAIKELEPIIQSAMQDKAYPEAIKAIGEKLVLEGNIQGNKPEEKILRMKAEIARAPAEMKPVMHAIQAHWYWHFFQQNRWRFLQRTNVGEGNGDDILTWPLPRVLAEIDAQFEAALAAEKELKATPIAAYSGLLTKGTIPDTYRPTLFDFLAFDAIGFYATGEQGGAKAQDTYELTKDSPIFATTDEFLKWMPETTDKNSRTVKAIRLFQNLLNFHKGDADPSAFLDTNLHRLRFGHNEAVGEGKDAPYAAALQRFIDAHANHVLSSMARSQLAGVLQRQGDLVKAREVALAGIKAFPESPGGKLCFNVVQDIEAKNANITTDRVWADRKVTVRVNYKNVEQVYFRLVKADYVDRLKTARWRPENLDQNEQKALLAKKPTHTFTAQLPATKDYKARTQDIPTPDGVTPGFYYLISSHDPDFGPGGNVVQYTDIWVADLAIVTRQDYGTTQITGIITAATTGEPLPGAQVQVWIGRPNGGWNLGGTVTTDKNGMYSAAGQQQRNHRVVVTAKNQQLATAHDQYVYQNNFVQPPHEQTIFFTDRSMYRPGQTIQYKGICIRYDQEGNNYTTLADRQVTVVFSDPNGKEITRQQARTNDYGSFSGTVIAPRDRLTGRMNLHVEGSPNGSTQFAVEEYKRPKFLVTVEAPKDPGKVNDTVAVPGKAVSYNGVPIAAANLRYRVVREVRYPFWFAEFCWWRPMPQRPAQEIANGTAITGPNGEFTIPFVAKPDLTVPEKDDPSFRYTVTVDVTDMTGETRTGSKTVEVGYTALRAKVTTGEWLTEAKDTKLTVSTTTLDDEPQIAKGTVKVYKLKQPKAVMRPELQNGYRPYRFHPIPAGAEPKPDPSKPVSWELGEVAFTGDFTTDAKGKAELSAKLPAGIYRAIVETKDKFGKAVTAKVQVQVLNPGADKLNIKIPEVVAAEKWKLEPGEEFRLYWGTGYNTGRAFVEIEHRGKLLHSAWTELGKTQGTVKIPVTEAMRGGFTARVTYVRENRAYLTSRHVEVPWTNKQLTVKWEHFVSKLEPGKKETFTAVITGPDAKRAVAEMVAAMYDESLDAFLPHHWAEKFGVFRQDHSRVNTMFENIAKPFAHIQGQWPHDRKSVELTYRGFPGELTQNYYRYEYFGKGGGGGWENEVRPGRAYGMGGGFGGAPMAPGMAAPAPAPEMQADAKDKNGAAAGAAPVAPPPESTGPDLSKVGARTNLNETAFFFPHLMSDAEGVVRMEFTMPEALTKWKFMGFAHDKTLRSGYLQDEVVTAKELMVQPNPPRFLREGDVIEFTAKISNQSMNAQRGRAKLSFTDARTEKSVDAALTLANTEQTFDLPPGESRTLSWRITVADGLGPIVYRVVAASDKYSDGEEAPIPVLSRRVLVTESIAMPIRNPGTKTFELAKLKESGNSTTIKSQAYTVQVTSQPAWYAVQALPYLMEFPHECSEQTFNRLYANALARHIAASDPKIRKVFDLWKGTAALDSPLEKNQELKSVLLDETPWVRQAVAETQARKNVGILFDENRLNQETASLTQRLAQMQYPDGSWPWFPGGPGNDYITLYITTGYGRLRHLGVKVDMDAAFKALPRLDNWAKQRHEWILAHAKPDENHLSPTIALYLYTRSFFLQDRPIGKAHKAALDYWLGQARKHWLQLANRQSQAHLALALKRFGDKDAATGIMKSIKERSVSSEEMGMFWRDTELSFSWYRAPIETQAMMVEAFDEVMNDAPAVEDCKVWLIKQKQTRDWKTTKATADAVYALLLRGENLLKSEALLEVAVGGQKVVPEKVEAGTGFYEQRWVKSEITPSMGTVTLTKTDPGVSWASASWQYLEDINKVTPHQDNPLKVEKRLFKRTFTKTGPVLTAVKSGDPLAVGDDLVVRVVIRTDRDMEYVHLKDHRGSGTEPVSVLSRYRFQDGLGYYESTKDTASHFFIAYLPKGTYVFEYALRVQLKGQYSTGFASLQCMYAPEFNSHSESILLDVK